ncbi:MAG: hypothetical protein M3Q64_00705 [bacterium]|nr:hypothetical protein [bacterium]
MVPVQSYKKFLTEFIRKHMVIFGPNIAREIAADISGIEVAHNGEVTQISGDATLILTNLVTEYQRLSGPITYLNLSLLLEAYPDIKHEYNQPLPRVRLICALTEEGK